MRTAILLLLAALAPAGLSAQGLGDTAARERQKRDEKKAAAPAKVYTEVDLPAPAGPPGAQAVAGGEALPSPGNESKDPAPIHPSVRGTAPPWRGMKLMAPPRAFVP